MHSVMGQRMLAGFVNKSTEYRIEYRRRIVYRTQNMRRPVCVCALCNETVTHWILPTKRSAANAATRKKNATSQIKCPMFATANATVAFRVCRDGGLGHWVAAKFMQSVCTMHAAAPIIIKHNSRFNASMFGPTKYRVVYYHRWLIHRVVVVSRSIACLSFVDVFVFSFFFCYAFSLWRFALILFELIWHHICERRGLCTDAENPHDAYQPLIDYRTEVEVL